MNLKLLFKNDKLKYISSLLILMESYKVKLINLKLWAALVVFNYCNIIEFIIVKHIT